MILWGAGKRMEECFFKILSMPFVGNEWLQSRFLRVAVAALPRAAEASGAVGRYVQWMWSTVFSTAQNFACC